MLIFVYHRSASDKCQLEDIVDNQENVKFISISDLIDNNHDNSSKQFVMIVGRVIKSNYGRHPRKGNYMKLHLTDVPKGDGKTVGVYMYKKAVIREKIQNGDLVGLSRAKTIELSSESDGVSELAYEVVCEEKTESTIPSIWVLTGSTPLHTYDYTPLKEVKENERHAVFGVVVSKEPISSTRGTSFVCCLKIKDKSITGDFNLNIFLNDKTDLPEINYGDILQCYIKGGSLNSRPCGTVFAPKQCVIWSNNLYGHLVPRTTASTFAMTAAEEKIITELREWVAHDFFHLLFVTPGKEAKPQNLFLKSLDSVREGAYFDLLCQVVEVFPGSGDSIILRVWDGTKLDKNLFFLGYPPVTHKFTKKHRIIYDYITDVHIFGEHCINAAKLEPEDFILMRNVHCSKFTQSGSDSEKKMKLQLHEGNRYGRTIVNCNRGQCIELKKKLDDVLTRCEESGSQLYFDSPIATRDPFQSSFEMYTQDLSPDLLQKVMERRAEEKGLCGPLIFQDDKDDENLDTVNEVLESVDDCVINQQPMEVNSDTNNERRLELNGNKENEVDPCKQRKGRWFVMVLQSKNDEEGNKRNVQDENKSEADIQVDGVFPYKRKNHVIDTVDLTLDDDSSESDKELPTTKSSTSTKAGRLTIELFGNTLPLSTLENVAAGKLGHKYRIRVKVREIEPLPSPSVINLLNLQCPICQYSLSCVKNAEPPVCSECYKPGQCLMKHGYNVTFLVQDRTGSLPVYLTGPNAEIFFGVQPSELLESAQSRKEVEDMLNWICSDNKRKKDVLNCKNPWLDLILDTVDRPYGLSHLIINTKCNIHRSPTKEPPSKKKNS